MKVCTRDGGICMCGVVEWVKKAHLKWFGNVERMGRGKFIKL